MIERLFIVMINGNISYKDSAIRTYKTRERAIKETQRYVKLGHKVEIGELSLINLEDITKEESE